MKFLEKKQQNSYKYIKTTIGLFLYTMTWLIKYKLHPHRKITEERKRFDLIVHIFHKPLCIHRFLKYGWVSVDEIGIHHYPFVSSMYKTQKAKICVPLIQSLPYFHNLRIFRAVYFVDVLIRISSSHCRQIVPIWG